MRIIPDNENTGLPHESTTKIILEEFFNIKLENTKKFDIVDFKNDEFLIELKTRFNKYSQYPTTMIGQNKINYFKKNLDKRCILVFKFTDGIYYYELTDKSSLIENKSGGRNDRDCDEYKNKGYCYINISELTKINN